MEIFKKNRYFFFFGFSLLLLAAFFFNFFSLMDYKLNDLLIQARGERNSDSRIVIVEVDDASVKALEKPWPWKRSILAGGLENIAAQNPKAIGLDFIFSDSVDTDTDLIFLNKINEIEKKTPIVSASNFSVKKESAQIQQQKMLIFEETLDLPFFKIPAGFVNVLVDSDQNIRRVQLIREFKNQKQYFFSLVLLSLIEGFSLNQIVYEPGKQIHIPKKNPLPLDADHAAIINYSGTPGSYKKISFFQVYHNLLPENFFKDKIVLIGPTLTLSNDFHYTPFSDYQGLKAKMSGIEILANILENLLNHNFYTKVPGWLCLLFILGLLCLFFYFTFKPQPAFKIMLGMLFCIIVFSAVAFVNLIWFGKLGPNFLILLSIIVYGLLLLIFNLSLGAEKRNQTKPKIQVHDDFIRKYNISQREREIIELILEGFDNNRITKKLFISLSTVKKHIYSIFQKVGCNKREELVFLISQQQENKTKQV